MIKQKLINILSFFLYYTGLIHILRSFGKKYFKILVYHSVDEKESIFTQGTGMFVSLKNFKKHIKYISTHYNPVSLHDFVKNLSNKKLIDGTIIITFDDGFADNFHVAYPLLNEYDIPATIFLVIETLKNKDLIWIQKLCYLINTKGVDTIYEAISSIHPDIKNGYSDESLPVVKKKQTFIEEYLTYSIKNNQRNKIISKLFQKFKISQHQVVSKNRIFLNWAQIKIMANNGISFGNHCSTHTPLSQLTREEQELEVLQAKNELVENLNPKFIPLAYPFGQEKDYLPSTEEIVKNLDHQCILDAKSSLNTPETPPYKLSRTPINNVPVYRFAFDVEKPVLKKIFSLK